MTKLQNHTGLASKAKNEALDGIQISVHLLRFSSQFLCKCQMHSKMGTSGPQTLLQGMA